MSREHRLLTRMRRTKAGWKDKHVIKVLKHYGYEKWRESDHGTFRSRELAEDHPDLETRMKYAYFIVPRGKVKEYIVRDLIAAIDALEAFRQGR